MLELLPTETPAVMRKSTRKRTRNSLLDPGSTKILTCVILTRPGASNMRCLSPSTSMPFKRMPYKRMPYKRMPYPPILL